MRPILFVHHEHLINVLAAVAQAWNLMLSAQLALAFQPFIEESRLGLHNLQMLKGNVVEALGLVIAVDFLQLLV